MAKAKRNTPTMTAEHKAALAVGRNESRAVKRYLEALEATRPKRGRKRTTESVSRRLSEVEAQIATADPLSRVNLIQERLDLTAELSRNDDAIDLAALESEFVKAAAGYGQRKKISYAAWREVGVSAAVLKQAGISRSA